MGGAPLLLYSDFLPFAQCDACCRHFLFPGSPMQFCVCVVCFLVSPLLSATCPASDSTGGRRFPLLQVLMVLELGLLLSRRYSLGPLQIMLFFRVFNSRCCSPDDRVTGTRARRWNHGGDGGQGPAAPSTRRWWRQVAKRRDPGCAAPLPPKASRPSAGTPTPARCPPTVTFVYKMAPLTLSAS